MMLMIYFSSSSLTKTPILSMNFIIKNPSENKNHLRLARVFDRMNRQEFIKFYLQLKKLKEKRSHYRIDFVLKQTYPDLTHYSLIEIDEYITRNFINS